MRGGERFVRQLSPMIATPRRRPAQRPKKWDRRPGLRADLAEPGAINQIVFRRLPPAEMAEEDVEIAVEAAALNFKDVMNAMGLLPENAVSGGLTSHRLGLEVAGRVFARGVKVGDLQVGDAVMARVAEGFAGRVITPARRAAPACAFDSRSSRRHSRGLRHRMVLIVPPSALAAGETVLIHSAAGGVGGAAIQLAKRAGAAVIATAGTKEKRDLLRQQGIEHVFDSRSLECFNQIMEVTGNRGVDIVLNSLTGRFITQSLKCLAPFGRFIEIGKADIYRNSKLNMERLGEKILLLRCRRRSARRAKGRGCIAKCWPTSSHFLNAASCGRMRSRSSPYRSCRTPSS